MAEKKPEKPDPTEVSPEAALYAEFKASTIALRDAELALMAVQQRHQKALDALRRFVAPVGPQQQG